MSGEYVPPASGNEATSTRKRILDFWFIRCYQANDPKIKVHKLCGATIQEANGYQPTDRFTITSPIASCKGNVVTTASGSVYHLTSNPMEGQSIYSPEQYIADEYLNPWLDGDNWLTI